MRRVLAGAALFAGSALSAAAEAHGNCFETANKCGPFGVSNVGPQITDTEAKNISSSLVMSTSHSCGVYPFPSPCTAYKRLGTVAIYSRPNNSSRYVTAQALAPWWNGITYKMEHLYLVDYDSGKGTRATQWDLGCDNRSITSGRVKCDPY